MTTAPREIVRTAIFALELEPGWSASPDATRALTPDSAEEAVEKSPSSGSSASGEGSNASSDAADARLILRGGEDTDDFLEISPLPRVVDAEEMCVLLSQPLWKAGAPPIAQSEKLGHRDGWSATFDARQHRYTSVVFNFDAKVQLFALCHAPLHRFPAVWAAARRMLGSVTRPDHQPKAPSGKLTRGLAGLTESWLQRFSEMVTADLKGRGLSGTFDDDAVVVGDARLTLEPAARQCRDAHGYEWSGVVRRYIDANIDVLTGAAEDNPYNAVGEKLILRMYPVGVERARGVVSRTDLEGVLTALALDLPTTVENVTPQQVEAWGRPLDALFETALGNLMARRVDLRREKVGDGEMAVLSQPIAGSSYALLLDRFSGLVGRHGSFVAVPVLELTTVLPFDDAGAVTVLLDGFWQYARDLHGRSTYTVSPRIFFWDRSAFEPIELSLQDGVTHLVAGPRLAAALRRVKRPTLIEVEARDRDGAPIWTEATAFKPALSPAAKVAPAAGASDAGTTLPDIALDGPSSTWIARLADALDADGADANGRSGSQEQGEGPPQRDVPFSGPLGDGTFALLTEVDGVPWTAFPHDSSWDPAAVDRLLDCIGRARAAVPGLCVRVYSSTPLPEALTPFLRPHAATDFQLEGRLTVRERPDINALTFRGLMQKYFSIEPPFTLKGLEAVDRVLLGDITQEERRQFLPSTINLLACFFGQVMLDTQGGDWVRFSRSTLGWGLAFGPPKMGLVRKPDGPVIDIRIVTRQCLQTDKKLSASYWTMQYDIAQMRG